MFNSLDMEKFHILRRAFINECCDKNRICPEHLKKKIWEFGFSQSLAFEACFPELSSFWCGVSWFEYEEELRSSYLDGYGSGMDTNLQMNNGIYSPVHYGLNRQLTSKTSRKSPSLPR
jgi:hypothetical protein